MAGERLAACAVVLVAGAAVALVEADLDLLPLQLTAGLLLLVLPGYALCKALLPRPVAGAAERVLITVALSVAVAIAGALALELSPWDLSRRSWALFLAGVAVVASVAMVSTNRGVERARSRPRLPRLRDAALLAVATSIAAAAIGLAVTPLRAPDDVSGYSELWLLPRSAGIELGVASQERSRVGYRLDLSADGRLVGRWRGALATGDRWQVEMPALATARSSVVEARLYRLDRPASVYRRVRLRAGTNPTAAASLPTS